MARMIEGGGYNLPQVPYLVGKAPVQYVPPAIRAPSKPVSSTPKKKKKSSSSGSSSSSKSSSSSYSSGSSNRSRSSGGGGGYSTKSVGSTATGQVAPIATPAVPTLDQFLAGDSSYQDQMAQFNKALADYQAQNNAEIGQYNTNYASNRNDLGIQQGRADEDLQNDFASRGMYVSGLQAKDRSDLLNDFSRRFSDLDTQRSTFLADQARDLGNYQSDVTLGRNKAKTDAINRRALKYQV